MDAVRIEINPVPSLITVILRKYRKWKIPFSYQVFF